MKEGPNGRDSLFRLLPLPRLLPPLFYVLLYQPHDLVLVLSRAKVCVRR